MTDVELVKDAEPQIERRMAGRIDARIGAGVSVNVIFDTSRKPVEFYVLDYSSVGLGVECRHKNADEEIDKIREDDVVEVDFRLFPKEGEAYWLFCRVTDVSRQNDGRLRLSLSRMDSPNEASIKTNIFEQTLELGESTNLLGLIFHPFLFDQTSVIHVKRISKKYMVVQNFDNSFAVFPTMPVIFSLNTFGAGEPIMGHIGFVCLLAGGMEFGIQIDSFPESSEKSLVRHILTLSQTPPFDLRKAGLNTSEIKSVINYRFVKTQKEYIEALRIRKHAYTGAKKLSKTASLNDVSHTYDKHSRILSAWHNDLLVGSVSIHFADGTQELFEVQKYIKPEEFARLPAPSDMIEVVGLSIHHSYRKSDILMGFFERLFQVLIESKRSYVLVSCDSYLWNIYQSIGFEKTGITYIMPKTYGMNKEREIELNVILINRRVPSYGAMKLDPMRWNEIYSDMSKYLDKKGVLPRTLGYRLVSPVYKMYIDYMKFLQHSRKLLEDSQKGFIQADFMQMVLEMDIVQQFLDQHKKKRADQDKESEKSDSKGEDD